MKKKVIKPKAVKKMTPTKALQIPPHETAWKPCTLGETDLEILVFNGMLQP
jgi:hypothetical protein